MLNNRRREELTFKHNLAHGRHGWLRLTPAYSIKLVREILDRVPDVTYVLDPFSGTGTTGLCCAERDIRCDLVDINPFLVWFAKVKTANYQERLLCEVNSITNEIVDVTLSGSIRDDNWVPPINNISRWWAEEELKTLAHIHSELEKRIPGSSPSKDLLLISFCRLLIETSNAAFNHQSMSFKDQTEKQQRLFADDEREFVLQRFVKITNEIVESARSTINDTVRVINADSRHVPIPGDRLYDCIITSPPYPNRMSYIRELRPYMYWLGYLVDARDAGELDWQAIGGTWGIATSRLSDWKSEEIDVDFPDFDLIISRISNQSKVLAKYVHKYFVDTRLHLQNLRNALAPGARVFYVVGNSKFYETVVPTEEIYAHLLEGTGYVNVSVDAIRKRNSKNELYEYTVSATKG